MAARDVIFAAVVLLAVGITGLVGHYALNSAVDEMMTNTVVASSQPTLDTLGMARGISDRADYLFLALFIGLTLGIMVTAWLVGGHPIWMIAFLVVIFVAVVLSAMLSNVWAEVATHVTLAPSVSSFSNTAHILGNLPWYIAGMGFMGLVVMFGKPFIMGDEY